LSRLGEAACLDCCQQLFSFLLLQVFVSPALEYSMDPCYAAKTRWGARRLPVLHVNP
jgi:hypothetical protein